LTTFHKKQKHNVSVTDEHLQEIIRIFISENLE